MSASALKATIGATIADFTFTVTSSSSDDVPPGAKHVLVRSAANASVRLI
jgi:hypothetical protein